MTRTNLARRVATAALAVSGLVWSACTMHKQEAPPLTGPSEMGQSIVVTVSPDILTLDGASQSLVTITARGPNGEPLRNVSLRAETYVNGVRADFGSLSARNLVTGADGRATLVYTAPAIPAGFNVDDGTQVTISVTPIGSDFANSSPRVAAIRLVPPGTVVPPSDLDPAFTFSPAAPQDHQTVLFDGSTSKGAISSYSWNFGDGSTASGKTATHAFNSAGSYVVTLTISDSVGRTSSKSTTIDVSVGTGPAAAFTTSPASPQVLQSVNFNASGSVPAGGRKIVGYDWDFGDGELKHTSVPTTTHDYATAGTFTITLTVTDDAGRTGVTTGQLTVTSDNPTADFTFSPTSPAVGAPVTFNGSLSSSPATPPRTLTYFWDFGGAVPNNSSSISPTVTYAVKGTYNVTLTVTDSAGKVGRVTKPVTVQ